ncbi:MAG: ABC transporter substrate-binding protein [Spirochaetia bacterium]|jgi:NitT/TauT family transport system substrate-binding protein|uniref:Riboflavin-binding protein RibY n=1 Tax=bioreactor metagenome TaxID=1076179 RepID=A0A644TED1_9ZZZZ|nr:ABC transporter substrate-binding protein [Spirochaetia bacterium]MDD3819916.1 ABC transporter substrate-binding protein [Spirochaetales bacterium]NLX46455.1 ABC transporter substrate-binding protein [Treponema sp.]VBB38611.1 Membrane lipoprotein lipid attachment site [uncultured Spirochaetota bacterium]MCE1209971.1 ABC transporter substrate-binding protein [Spirochaetia bacterium]
MRKRIIATIAFALLVLAGISAQATKINFQLNWKISGDHAPYYVAMEKGWFKEEGLDVNVMIGQGSGFTVQMVDAGKAQIGISDAPVPIEARAKGANVKIVGIIFDKHPNCMFFWKDSGIKAPQDLKGKTVAVPASDGHKVMWPAFAKLIGLNASDVKFINIEPTAKPAALGSKQADVVFELFTGKPFMEKAVPADQLGWIIWADYGFNAYAHSYIANADFMKNNPEALRKFLKVSYKAWQYTLNNIPEAISILSKYHPINTDDFIANLTAVKEFFKTDRYKNYGIGYIDPSRMQDTINTVKEKGLAMNPDPNYYYSSEFLPSPPFKFNF